MVSQREMIQSAIVLIPARSGSQSIQDKNVQTLGGLPLIAQSIKTGLELVGEGRVIVSTDSPLYADIARNFGATVPFLRPKKLSLAQSRDFEYIKHLKEHPFFEPFRLSETLIVLLRPTYPIRSIPFLLECIQAFQSQNYFCMLKSVSLVSETPFKMWFMKEDKELRRVIGNYEDDLHNSPRQSLEKVYWQDGYLDVLYPCATENKVCQKHKKKMGGVISPVSSHEIDYKEDFETIDRSMNNNIEIERNENRLFTVRDTGRYGS